ncbi:uncharacterized protein BDZ99DRAFT_353053, partial [Mytilinidion resinicola]
KRLLLACPFNKKDPARYGRCHRVTLTKISFVKQHLSRKHQLPIYCSRCMSTFDTEAERDTHARASACELSPIVNLEGITEAQRKRLREKVPSGMNEEQQWFTIFDMLFPDFSPRPRTAYIDPDLSEELCSFRDFATNAGSGIMIQQLRDNGFIGDLCDSQISSLLETVITDGFQVIIERW